MDTRQKIIELNELAQQTATGKWTVVPGLFDPLTATQAKRLEAFTENGHKLAAIVLNHGHALLPAPARAALIAALRAVDLVAIASDGEWRAALAASPDVRIVEDPEGEAARSAEFVQFILDRQKSA